VDKSWHRQNVIFNKGEKIKDEEIKLRKYTIKINGDSKMAWKVSARLDIG